MWLLTTDTHELKFFEDINAQVRPRYAVLSHRWGEGEATFKEVMKARQKQTPGWMKILRCCEQAKRDGYEYVWIDTCCIDKRSSAELSEAINSMFKWYQLSQVCYAYLSDCTWDGEIAQLRRGAVVQLAESRFIDDVIWHCNYDDCGAILFDEVEVREHLQMLHDAPEVNQCHECQYWFPSTKIHLGHMYEHEISEKQFEFTQSVWFQRGWTLQELLAPTDVIFYNKFWRQIGTKRELWTAIEKRTRIPRGALLGDFKHIMSTYCIAERMSWAAGRQTTRVEDRAHSLLGLFNVNMPLLYGEGKVAFQRLQEELVRTSQDSSIFAWTEQSGEFREYLDTRYGTCNGMLADNPDSFANVSLKGFWPAARHFSWSKEGIEDNFALFRHRFEIFAAVLGHFGRYDVVKQIPNKVFVVYLVRVAKDQYRRICVETESFGVFDQFMTRES